MCWVFPCRNDRAGYVHGCGEGFGVVVRDDGGQHAGEFRRAGKVVFHFKIHIAFRGHKIASFTGVL